MSESAQKASINVEEIMAEIRRDILKKNYGNEDLAFSEVPVHGSSEFLSQSNTLAGNIRHLRNIQTVSVYRPLKSRRIIGPLIIFFKKVVRKLIRFYIEPIVADQNDVNNLSAACFEDLYFDMEILRRRIKLLEEENKNK